MKEASVLGLDIAKSVFSVVGLDGRGKVVLRRKLRRGQVLSFFRKFPPLRVGLEACGGSHYWARELGSLGHEVRLIAPQFVKPYVKSNKNDLADAEAIAEALTRPTMRFVPSKTQFQQDLQSMHRIRERLVRNRTALANSIRGILHEYGVILPQGIRRIRMLPLTLLCEEEKLSDILKRELKELHEEFRVLDRRIMELEKRLRCLCRELRIFQRLRTIPGVGELTASTVIAAVGDVSVFKNARQFAAWLGLVPRHSATGGKTRLGSISKRGDVYLRKLLVHGARAVLRTVEGKTDRVSCWAQTLSERRGKNRAAVALANKNARIIWAVLSREEDYRCYPRPA